MLSLKKLNRDGFKVADNVEAIISKGLRASCLSKYTEANARCNVELTTKTFIGYSLCYAIGFYC